jgi:hypothetical protein
MYEKFEEGSTYWNDPRKMFLLNKDPNQHQHHRRLREFFEKENRDYIFVTLLHDPCFSRSGKLDPPEIDEMIRETPKEKMLVIHYLDLITRPDYVYKQILRKVPQLGSLHGNVVLKEVKTTEFAGKGVLDGVSSSAKSNDVTEYGQHGSLADYIKSDRCRVQLTQTERV